FMFDLGIHISYTLVSDHVTGGNGVNHKEHDLKKLSTAWVEYIILPRRFFALFYFGG
ncbi:hypothetical protein CcarbDRAFT_0245, partial [Clostridium carboxidivorans P7]